MTDNKDVESDVEWNDGYITEGLDRCHTIMTMMDVLLVDHPAIKLVKAEQNLKKAFDEIFDIYQKIGELDL